MPAPKKTEFIISARDRTRAAFRSITRNLRRMTAAAVSAASRVARVGAAIAGGFGIALGRAAERTADLADGLNADVELLQALQFGLRETGGTTEQATEAFRRFFTQMGRARTGDVPTLTNAFAKLGITLDDLNRQKPEVVFERAFQAFRRLGPEIGSALFFPIGETEGVQAFQRLSGEFENFDELRAAAHAANAIRSRRELADIERAQESVRRLGEELKAIISVGTARLLIILFEFIIPKVKELLADARVLVDRMQAIKLPSATQVLEERFDAPMLARFARGVARGTAAQAAREQAFFPEQTTRILNKIERNTRGGSITSP